ncbi:MAG: Rieske 2Fe-2S domain-containing protein [Polyangiaceae bacterium]|nr:Rieske 2Fe-2S domain-containing protein [Polyangiaceae bacterium]
MTTDTWLDLGPIAQFPEDRPVLRKAGGQRFACVRRGEQVHAVDDRCPHQGYPLSQGSCADGVLTCEWHNWKFDIATGENTFGGEAVRRYPTRVDPEGRVHLNPAIDKEREASRLRVGLSKALHRDQMGRALREGLRLGAMVDHPQSSALGSLAPAFELVAHDGARRAEYGFDHGLAVFADLVTWAERGWITPEEAFVSAAHAVAEASIHLPERATSRLSTLESPLDPSLACDALIAERRDEAEARVRTLAAHHGAETAPLLVPFLTRHLYDYGHSAIFTTKAAEIARRFPAIAQDVFGSLAVSLSWATAETVLPPFAATRAALERLSTIQIASAADEPLDLAARSQFEAAILSGEQTGANAAVDLVQRGVHPRAVLRVAAHAAATRLSRFDSAWEQRVDAEVGALDVTHTVTFAEAALALSENASLTDIARFAVFAAAFAGRVKNGDRADVADPAPRTNAPDLLSALRARDPGRAVVIAREMSAAERLDAYTTLAPFAALEAAVRPIFYAHTVKNAEALRRLEMADPLADDAYLVALVSYIAPVRPEFRPRRLAHVAKKFFVDGRPPEGLY